MYLKYRHNPSCSTLYHIYIYRAIYKNIKFYQQNISFTFSLNLFPRSNSFLNIPKEAAPGDRITTSPFSAFSFNESKRESKLSKGPLYSIAFSLRRGIKGLYPFLQEDIGFWQDLLFWQAE